MDRPSLAPALGSYAQGDGFWDREHEVVEIVEYLDNGQGILLAGQGLDRPGAGPAPGRPHGDDHLPPGLSHRCVGRGHHHRSGGGAGHSQRSPSLARQRASVHEILGLGVPYHVQLLMDEVRRDADRRGDGHISAEDIQRVYQGPFLTSAVRAHLLHLESRLITVLGEGDELRLARDLLTRSDGVNTFGLVEEAGGAFYGFFHRIDLRPLEDDKIRRLWRDLTSVDLPGHRAVPIRILTGGAADIAERTRMTSSQVSAHLGRLLRRGAVQTIYHDGSRQRYELTERLYNLYHLLRSPTGADRARALLEILVHLYELASPSERCSPGCCRRGQPTTVD